MPLAEEGRIVTYGKTIDLGKNLVVLVKIEVMGGRCQWGNDDE